MSLKEIESFEDWEKIKSQSLNKSEIILFKYSTMCSVSFTAKNIFADWLKCVDDSHNITPAEVNVIKGKETSLKIAESTGVRHESPQIIWLDKNLEIKWHASHFEINKKSLTQQLSLTPKN